MESEEPAPEMQRVRLKYWTAEDFTKEFYKYSELVLPPVFKLQVEKVRTIVEHWSNCKPCRLGFDFSEYSGTFEDIFLKLASNPIENYICKIDDNLDTSIFINYSLGGRNSIKNIFIEK